MVRRLSLLVLALALGASGVARAGPVWEGPDVDPFPLTLWLWSHHGLGPERAVTVAHRGDQRQVEWHVGFLSCGGRPLQEADRVLALPSAPADCEQLLLAVPILPSTEDAENPEYRPLKRVECIVERSPQAQCSVLTPQDDARGLVARFDRDFQFEVEFEVGSMHCELLRERCVADDRAFPWQMTLQRGFPFDDPVACSQVEQATQACRDAEQRAIEFTKREQRCRGLVLATRTWGAVDLEVVGPAGVEWGRDTVRWTGVATQAGVWILTPFTVVADVPITVVSMGYAWGYFVYVVGRG